MSVPTNNNTEEEWEEFEKVLYKESVYGNPNYSTKGWVKAKAWIEAKRKLWIQEAKKEERERIKHQIIILAIEGGKDPDELKGLLLYSRILKYFDDLSEGKEK